MKKIIKFTLAPLILVTSSSAFAQDPSTIAKEYCNCTKDSYEAILAASNKAKSGNNHGAKDILDKMDKAGKEAEACTEKLEKKYSFETLSDDKKQKVGAEIKRNCPMPEVEGLENLEAD